MLPQPTKEVELKREELCFYTNQCWDEIRRVGNDNGRLIRDHFRDMSQIQCSYINQVIWVILIINLESRDVGWLPFSFRWASCIRLRFKHLTSHSNFRTFILRTLLGQNRGYTCLRGVTTWRRYTWSFGRMNSLLFMVHHNFNYLFTLFKSCIQM